MMIKYKYSPIQNWFHTLTHFTLLNCFAKTLQILLYCIYENDTLHTILLTRTQPFPPPPSSPAPRSMRSYFLESIIIKFACAFKVRISLQGEILLCLVNVTNQIYAIVKWWWPLMYLVMQCWLEKQKYRERELADWLREATTNKSQ